MTTSGPLPQEVVARILDDHQRVLREPAELVGYPRPLGAGLAGPALRAKAASILGAGDLTGQIGSRVSTSGDTECVIYFANG